MLYYKKHSQLFNSNPNIEKINIGFTNTIYSVDNKYIEKYYPELINTPNLYKRISTFK